MRKTRGNSVKRSLYATICSMTLLTVVLPGCGIRPEDINWATNGVSDADVEASFGNGLSSSVTDTEIETLLQAGNVNKADLLWAGSQYVAGETVTLLRGTDGEEDLAKTQDIYLEDENGTLTKVISDAPEEYTGEWYYTAEGYCYSILENRLVRVEADGRVKYESIIGTEITDICRLENGGLFLVIRENEGNYRLVNVNENTGEFTILEAFDFSRDKRTFLAEGEEGLLVLNSKGLWKVDTEGGVLVEQISMSEYDIRLPYTIKDFKMLDDASLVFLHRDYVEVIHPKDIGKYCEIVTVQTRWENEWLSAMLDGFNAANTEYYAVLEPLTKMSESGNKMEAQSDEEVAKMIAGADGGDLIAGDCLECSRYVDAGYWEDLSPYMEQAGLELADYFPAAFEQGRRGESIYIANLYLTMNGLRIKEEVLGSRDVPDAEALVDRLLAYEEPAILNRGWDAEDVLRYLLAGSENLHGAVDWNAGTCDFESDFFYKVLEAAKLYGDIDEGIKLWIGDVQVTHIGGKLYQAVDSGEIIVLNGMLPKESGNEIPSIGKWYNQNGYYNYLNREQLELAEEVYLGYLFDDGNYPLMTGGVSLSMNANSDCKEGAWSVLEYLLSEEAQIQKALLDENGRRVGNRQYPVNIYAFEEVILLEMEETSYMQLTVPKTGLTNIVLKGAEESYVYNDVEAYRARYDLTEADIEEVRELVYEVKYLPEKPAEILELVCEGAAEYFESERSLDDTCQAIQKRVQEYLDTYEE